MPMGLRTLSWTRWFCPATHSSDRAKGTGGQVRFDRHRPTTVEQCESCGDELHRCLGTPKHGIVSARRSIAHRKHNSAESSSSSSSAVTGAGCETPDARLSVRPPACSVRRNACRGFRGCAHSSAGYRTSHDRPWWSARTNRAIGVPMARMANANATVTTEASASSRMIRRTRAVPVRPRRSRL